MTRILVACEESQVVTAEFRRLGFEAYSCDILPTSGLHPEWHLQQDVSILIKSKVYYDLVIAFPPCTHLASSGAKHFKQKQKDGRQQLAIDFFLHMFDFNAKYIAVENPIGIMSRLYRKPDQIVQPWMFCTSYLDNYPKSTCLWLKNLPKLIPIHKTQPLGASGMHNLKSGKTMSKWYYDTSCLPHKDRAKARSITPVGLARAMAEQWSTLL